MIENDPLTDADTTLLQTAALTQRMTHANSRESQNAARALYHRFGPLVWSISKRYLGDEETAREVVQDTMLAMWQSAHTFDPARGNAVSWAARIARSRAIDARRHAGAVRRTADVTDLDSPDALSSGFEHVENDVLATEQVEEVSKALADLPAEQRVLVELSFLQGYSQSEIASMLSLPLGTVKARILRGLARLRTTLEPLHAIEASHDGDQS